MSALLADIDATCASLGYFDGNVYHPESDALQGLKHIIWILRRDSDIHEYRRHLGRGKVLQTDLLPMLMHQTDENEMSDVLLRLMVNLTNPTLLLYREEVPKDGPGRRYFLELIEILQGYKAAYSLQPVWAALGKRLQAVLHVDWAERSEEQGLLIERILVLVRNVLQVPASPETERRADNDASLHDQVLWALQQAGLLDLVLYVIGSEYENQYHLHALEIVCLMYREQTAVSLSDASLQRSAAEKLRDEQELVAARRREKAKFTARPPPGRHSRFGGTYVYQNVKSISDKDLICHKPLPLAVTMNFDSEKSVQKRSHRVVKEEASLERRSAFSVRLFLREFCIEILSSAYNNLIRHVRRTLERNSSGHDDSYLLWTIRFFMEFNRLSGFQLQLVSESLSTQCFHWVLTRIQHHTDMIGSDKKNARLWAKRLHIGIQAFKELMHSLIALQKVDDDDAKALYKMLLNNVCYVLEFRETTLYTIMNYNEAHSTRAYLRDVIELANIFFKIMENFCRGKIVVQGKKTNRKRSKKLPTKAKNTKPMQENVDLENVWVTTTAPQLSAILTTEITLPEDDHPLPFDAVSDKTMDDQKDDCMIKIHCLLRQQKFEHAIILMRSAREVWPENDFFGAINAAPEDELMLLREIFLTNLGPVKSSGDDLSLIDGTYNDDNDGDQDDDDGDHDDNGNDDDDDDEEEGNTEIAETDFRFGDFEKRLVNPRVVRACTMVLADWEKITTRALKSAVTILHRIAFGCKVPTMLFQASLFRIFQKVFNSGKDAHHEELRKLGVYIIRKFVEIAPTNPKIFAELLFYKNLREANDIEMGYDGAWAKESNKKAWTEEQEDELRQLFMENQNNPSTDMDVIDWIMDNLIDKHRTRRGIIKKMKELGLIFKAPTKKSTAAAISKHAWHKEQDQQLRSLFDEHRLEKDCMKKIMEIFNGKRSKNAVINRMISLGLIADRSEVIKPRNKVNKSNQSSDDSDSDNDDDDREDDLNERSMPITNKIKEPKINRSKTQEKSKVKNEKKKQIVKAPLDTELIETLISEFSDQLKDVLGWLEESLNDAAEDIEDEPSDDPDDSVPLVPINAEQRDAIENANFRFFLISLGFHPPSEDFETYWRIPTNFTAEDIKIRARLVAGEDVTSLPIDLDSEPEIIIEDEPNDDSDKYSTDLIYNVSDNEVEIRTPLKRSTAIAKSKKKFDIFDMVKEDDSSNTNDSENIDVPNMSVTNMRQRLSQLVDSDESGNESDEQHMATIRKRVKTHAIIESDSDGEPYLQKDLSNLTASTLDSHPVEGGKDDLDHSSKGIHVSKEVNGTREGNNKRERSESEESISDEATIKTNKKAKNARRAIIDDDADDDY